MGDVIEEARRLKSAAMDARDLGDFDRATRLLESAERTLSAALEELRRRRDPNEPPGRQEIAVAEQLAYILGSTGGVLRRKGEYAAAARAYDAGYGLENPESGYGIVDSYNLVQRLVARVFLEPRAVADELLQVEGINVRNELDKARQEIARQRKGPRSDDEYAAADEAMVLLLLGDPDAGHSISAFLGFKPKPAPYALEVTLELIEALRDRVTSVPAAPLDLGERLSTAIDQFHSAYPR
jgi:hypothetical protein